MDPLEYPGESSARFQNAAPVKSQTRWNGISMASVVQSLIGPSSNGSSDFSAAAAPSPNLASYLQDTQPQQVQSQPLPPSVPNWQSPSFTPSTSTLIDAVKSLNLPDVQWFLWQLDIEKNGGKKTIVQPGGNLLPQTPTTPKVGAEQQPASPPAPQPSPYLSKLPVTALSLPASSPYILDILFDTILCRQHLIEFAEIQKQKKINIEKAKEDNLDPNLLDLLSPIPPIAETTIELPSPASEDALSILSSLIEAVDVVGVNMLSSASSVDYLRMSDIPYPLLHQTEIEEEKAEKWIVDEGWKKRVKRLEEIGVVLDVERTSTTPTSPFSEYPPPPLPTDFVIPPFSQSSRTSQSAYLQHTYLILLEKRQLFLTLVIEQLKRVRNIRAQSNYNLSNIQAEAEKRSNKILTDLQNFTSLSEQSKSARHDTLNQMEIDLAAAEKLERQAQNIRKEEYIQHRQSVLWKGERMVKTLQQTLQQRLEISRQKYEEQRALGIEGMKRVETSRQKLVEVNTKFDELALLLEERKKSLAQSQALSEHMSSYVTQFEQAVKSTKKTLKDTEARREASRAGAESRKIVELEISGRAVTLIYANTLTGVSNLFLKLFRCMSPAPDPDDKAPEVVWCPEPCYVSELCSPGPGRSASQVANPSWRIVKVDLWKLCEAEMDRYFKVEVWDCNASLNQVQTVVRSALEQAKIDGEQQTKTAMQESSGSAPPLNPDGSLVAPTPVSQQVTAVASVTLPADANIKYTYIGQAVCTLQQLLDASAKRRSEQEANAQQNSGIHSIPILNAQAWSAKHGIQTFTDSGTLTFNSVKVHEMEHE